MIKKSKSSEQPTAEAEEGPLIDPQSDTAHIQPFHHNTPDTKVSDGETSTACQDELIERVFAELGGFGRL